MRPDGALQIHGLGQIELEKKVGRKFHAIPLHSLIENFGLDAVDFGEIGIKDHPFPAKAVNHGFDRSHWSGLHSCDGAGHEGRGSSSQR